MGRFAIAGIFVLLAFPVGAPAQATAPTQDGRALLFGRVADAGTGEPIARVRVAVIGTDRVTTTDDSGSFRLENLAAGEIELYITSIGYGLLKKRLTLRAGDETELIVALPHEASPLREEVVVTAGPFLETEINVASEHTLTKSELQSLSPILIPDPVRAAQALPGVTGNDDFRSDFALRGAGFRRIGFYLDGVLLPVNPTHTVYGEENAGSLSIFGADTVSSVTLLSGAFPAKYGDSTVGVFQLATREGNRVKPSGRVSAGLLSTSAVFDGPLASGRGGWLVSARKSYLGYVLDRIEAARDEAEGLAIDFTDLQARASYDPGSRHKLGVGAVWSISDFDRSRVRNQLRAGDIMTSRSLIWLLQADWAYTPHSRFAARTRLFGLIGDFDNQNPAGIALDRGARTQAGVRSDVGAAPFARHNLEAGAYVRFLRGTGKEISLSASVPPQPTTLADYGRTAGHQGYYLQDTWSSPRLRFSVTGGLRIDHGALTRQTVVSPRAALGFSPWNGAALRLGWGRHAQFPEFAELFGARGNPNLRAEKAVHYNFSFEQMIGQTARLAAEAYYRAEQGLLFSLNDRYIRDGKLAFVSFPFRNSLHGLARGVEISLHRRSANRLVGWLAYSYSMTHLKDDPTGWSFVSNFDQRHNFSAFGSYRMSETLSLSASCRVGSGLPMVGFYRLAGSAYVTASERNRERLPRYSRTDVRVSKAFLLRRSKLTLAAEVLNLLGHDNFRQDGRRLEKMLPFLPSVSLALEF